MSNKDQARPLTIYREPARVMVSITRWRKHEGHQGILRTHAFYEPRKASLARIERVAQTMQAHQNSLYDNITSYQNKA